jgi:hypothetical protein
MNKEQTIEAIRVMQAFVDGKEVEFKLLSREYLSNNEWRTMAKPAWDFDRYTYRIKPTAKLRPWTADEVPMGAWMRKKQDVSNRWLVIDTRDELWRQAWFEESEHSTDCGKTWKECGVMEEGK